MRRVSQEGFTHRVVLDLALAQRRAVVADDDELGCTRVGGRNGGVRRWRRARDQP